MAQFRKNSGNIAAALGTINGVAVSAPELQREMRKYRYLVFKTLAGKD